MTPDDIPEIDMADYTLGSLMTALLTGELPAPVWVRNGRTRHKITPENKEGVAKGLLIALEIQG